MKSFLATLRAGFLYLWSEPVSVIMLTLFPVVLIFVLGSALDSLMSGDSTIEPVSAAFVSEEDESPLYVFLTSSDTAQYIEIVRAPREEAERMLRDLEVYSVVVESTDGVEIIQRSTDSSGARLVSGAVEAYRGIAQAAALSARSGRDPTAHLLAEIRVSTAEIGGHVPEAIDYYAVTMLVMILLYTGMNGMSLFAKNMAGEFGERLAAAPVRRGVVAASTVAASTAVSYLQGLITFAFSALVYGVYWGERIAFVLLVLFVMALFSQMLCIFGVLLFREQGKALGVLQLFFWVSTFVSKGFVKVDFGAAEKLFQYAPNALAHTAIFGAIYGGSEPEVTRSLLILCGLTAALGAGAYLLGRRRPA